MDFIQEKHQVLNESEVLDETNEKYMKIRDTYAGVQYPKKAELGMAYYLMTILKLRFRCVDPLNEGLKKFKDRKIEIGQVKDQIFCTLGCSQKSDFASDLPLNLHEFMQDRVFKDLIYAKDFQQSASTREQVQTVITGLLSSWEGPNTETTLKSLENSIKTAEECGRDNIIAWYINCVAPILQNQAKAEAKMDKRSIDSNTQPISKFIRAFFEYQASIKDDVQSDFIWWQFTINYFKEHLGQMNALEKSGAKYIPPVSITLDKFDEKDTADGKEE